MARPLLSICVRCDRGDELFERVKEIRKERGLKEVFKIDDVDCLGVCDPCVIELQGKKRSTYLRSGIHPRHDAERVIDAMCSYAALEAGQELPERALPGDHND